MFSPTHTDSPNQNEQSITQYETYTHIKEDMYQFDSRTTLMVRNIPNRLIQSILLNFIDEMFLGCYDFFYMPIDKNSQANMGYAFINMTHPKHVVEFHNEFHKYKWPHASSTKICEVSFARIQG